MSVLSFVALDFFLISDRTGNLQTPTCQCFLTFWRLHDESKIINGLIYNKDNPELQPQTINSYCIFILEREVANTQFTAELQRTFNNLTIWNLELLKCLCLVEHSSQTFFVIMPFMCLWDIMPFNLISSVEKDQSGVWDNAENVTLHVCVFN